MSKRPRTEADDEAAAAVYLTHLHQAAFIKNCVEHTTNITVVAAAAELHNNSNDAARDVIIAGTLAELKKEAQTRAFLGDALYNGAVAAALADGEGGISAGETVTLSVPRQEGAGFRTVTLAALPTQAARTNCPHRPDAFLGVAAAAATTAAGRKTADNTKKKLLDVFICSADDDAQGEAALLFALARAVPHSFSAKGGAAANGYTTGSPLHVRVALRGHGLKPVADTQNKASPPLEEVLATVANIQLAQRLVDAPTSLLDTASYEKIASGLAARLAAAAPAGVTVTFDAIVGDDLARRGYGGIYAVGRGAERAPRLLTLHYHNAHAEKHSKTPRRVALVGKGLVYDCGGLALKTPTVHMCNMKTDMAGSAGVLGAFVSFVTAACAAAAATTQHPRYADVADLSVTLCAAENAIGPEAFRNDDILLMKSGLTVEINNTDAEGRLALGDGVAHATGELSFTPDTVLDMATLTGAQGIATGVHHAAIYSNKAEAEAAALAAGRRTGDTCFPVLYCPEYHQPLFRSNHADMRNLMSNTVDAGVSCAGYFVESHLNKAFAGSYIHVDMAFPSFNERGAAGYGVALVTDLLAHH